MKNTDSKILKEIQEVLAQPRTVTIVPHENPDGDAIGSALGLGQILSNVGHKVCVVTPNDYPDFLKWFSAEVPVMVFDRGQAEAQQQFKKSDLLICLDFNEQKRAGKLAEELNAFEGSTLMIDHHPYPANFCQINISETSYSSTAELVCDVAMHVGLDEYIDDRAAEALYTGILTDTGGFSHNFNKNTFRIVARLMDQNLNTDKIQSNVFHNFSADRMKLLGFCLHEKMEVFPEYRAAFISITKEELERFRFKQGDTEGFVNYPLAIKDVVFSALFIENENMVKASFRSKGNFAANEFSAQHFNGGGHLNAAGGRSELKLQETIEKFKQLLPQYQHQLLNTTI